MIANAIKKLAQFGQSVWLDNISADLMAGGKLQKMIDLGLLGLTSNPAIFERAVAQSADYNDRIRELHNAGKPVFEIYDTLTISEIQRAADLFSGVFKKTRGRDGFVSLEVSPKLANSAIATITEGMRIARAVNRPNLMIKVPATPEGCSALEELIAQGIHVNATLIFSPAQYTQAALAFLRGLERLSVKRSSLRETHSVASIFVSRLDTFVDALLGELIHSAVEEPRRQELLSLRGKAAVANATVIYSIYRELFSSKQFNRLAEKGAAAQRVLWASTSTKNPSYSPIKYVAELIAKDTVNTMPDETFDAFLFHGEVKEAVSADDSGSKEILRQLNSYGISLDTICDQLLAKGLDGFKKSFDSLLRAIAEKAAAEGIRR